MVTPEIIAVRERTLAAHLDGESRKDVDAVLATFSGVPRYELMSVDKIIDGHDDVRKFLQLFFDSMGPNEHLGKAFYHAAGATAVEVLTVFPDGFDGKQTGQVVKVRSVGVFTFEGDRMLAEKLYADVSPLVPFMPWLVEA
jgi:limonene-1,2-epoxide hydrolase